MKIKIAVTGGGTGGHVFPAFAVMEKLPKDKFDFVWIGSRTGIEKKLTAERGIEFLSIPSGKLRRYISLQNIFDLFKVGAGILRSIRHLRKHKIALVFSKGGFVSVPPVLAARFLGIPVVSHESDYDPGLATKINAFSSSKICLPYEETKKFFRPKIRRHTVVTGNPVREDIFSGDAQKGREYLSVKADKKILLVQGGSLGAKQLNDCVPAWIEKLPSDWFIIHQRGREPWTLGDIPDRYKSYDFISKPYADILAASSFVVSRAGAGSIWEIGVTKKPCAFLPLVEGSRGDQVRNAKHTEQKGASITLSQENATQDLLDFILVASQEKLEIMAQNWDRIVHAEGANRAAELIRKVARV